MYRSRRRGWGDPYGLFDPKWLEEGLGSQTERAGRTGSVLEGENPEREDYRELLQRLQADFINFKRRVEQDREQQTTSANRELILRILPVLDDLERALSSVPEEMADSEWVKGTALVERKLRATLEEEGLERIEAEGKEFDPREHEAVFCEDSPEHEEGKVKGVLRNGYKLHDRVIRPAQVVVYNGKAGPGDNVPE